MYRSLLVANDGSARATKALKAAIRMARGSGAKLHVLNVQPPFLSTLATAHEAAFALDKGEFDARVSAASERVLGEARRLARSQGVRLRLMTLPSASVAQAIVRTAKKVRADLIIMASHGRGPVANLLLGSTTQKVLAACRIPLLIHR